MDASLKERLLNSIENDRLVLFCGAGLSMSKPSEVPSAAELAKMCAASYAERYAALPEDTSKDLEKVAEYFFEKNLLIPTFINNLIPRGPFLRDPNSGHYAIADFLSSAVIDFAVSTNVDVLIEAAGEELGEPQSFVAIDATEANVPHGHRPHLKIHGCLRKKDGETVWCKSQLQHEPLKSRLADLDIWLRAHLVGRDVIFLGFWSDWAYLNEIFERSVDAVEGGLIVIVNPSDDATLAAKAPRLWEWSGNGKSDRFIVPQLAADFLDELRRVVWVHFMNRVLRQGTETLGDLTGVRSDAPTVSEALGSQETYQLKQDSCGIPAKQISRVKRPNQQMNVLGAVHVGLLRRGAEMDGRGYQLNGKYIRILNALGQLLTPVRKQFEAAPTLFQPADIHVCVGAKDDGAVAVNITRGNKQVSTIVRPATVAEWITEEQAEHLWRPTTHGSAS